MTREEIERGALEHIGRVEAFWDKSIGVITLNQSHLLNAFIAGAEFATPKWISVEERLPEEGVRVLTCCRGRNGETAYFEDCLLEITEYDVTRRSFRNGMLPTHYWQVTHWMPLLGKPEVEKENED